MRSAGKHGFDPKIERLDYQPRPAADVLFDPPKFPDPPRDEAGGSEQQQTHSQPAP